MAMEPRPTGKQYKENIQMRSFCNHLISHCMASNPNINAIIEPAITSATSSRDIGGAVDIPIIEAANIVGTDSKKEKVDADCLLEPSHKPVTIVAPLRDIPGNIDTP